MKKIVALDAGALHAFDPASKAEPAPLLTQDEWDELAVPLNVLADVLVKLEPKLLEREREHGVDLRAEVLHRLVSFAGGRAAERGLKVPPVVAMQANRTGARAWLARFKRAAALKESR